MNRGSSGPWVVCAFGKLLYACEELVAELGAVLLVDRRETSRDIESHADYLGHWVEQLKESPWGVVSCAQ